MQGRISEKEIPDAVFVSRLHVAEAKASRFRGQFFFFVLRGISRWNNAGRIRVRL